MNDETRPQHAVAAEPLVIRSIPCTEQLPPNNDEVLILVAYENDDPIHATWYGYRENAAWFGNCGDYEGWIELAGNIVGWIPLPTLSV